MTNHLPAPDAFVSVLADARGVLRSWSAPDSAQDQLRTQFLRHLRLGAPAVSRDGDPAHLTASCVVLSSDLRHTLLTLHRKAGMWLQLGGHLEPQDRSLRGAALREGLEESGLERLDLTDFPVDLDRHTLAGSFGHCRQHLDVRYAAVAGRPTARPAATTESLKLRWWPVDALPDEDGAADLSRLVSAAVAAVAAVATSSQADGQASAEGSVPTSGPVPDSPAGAAPSPAAAVTPSR